MTDTRRPDEVPFAPESVRGVVFDLDGTLIDSYSAITAAVNAARSHFGEPPLSVQQVRSTVGHGLEQLMLDLMGPHRAVTGAQVFRRHYATHFAGQTSVLPGVGQALGDLRRAGFSIAVASNKPARFSRPILAQLGLSEYVEVVHGPDTVGSTKPEPTMIRTCLDDLGVPVAAAAYVGDMVLDAESAARAGVPALLVATGSSTADELRDCGTHVYEGLAAIAELLIAHRS